MLAPGMPQRARPLFTSRPQAGLLLTPLSLTFGTGVDAMNTQRLMAKYSARYGAGVTGVLDGAEFKRLREEIITPQDKAMGTLEQVAAPRVLITHVLRERSRKVDPLAGRRHVIITPWAR